MSDLVCLRDISQSLSQSSGNMMTPRPWLYLPDKGHGKTEISRIQPIFQRSEFWKRSGVKAKLGLTGLNTVVAVA